MSQAAVNQANRGSIQCTVFSLTICIDTSKAIWNWYLQLFLSNQGVFVVDLGVIKSSSLIAKASLQLVIPALEDSGGLVAFSPVSAQVCAHFLDVLAVILTVPIVMTFEVSASWTT